MTESPKQPISLRVWVLSISVLLLGIAIQYTGLALAEAWVHSYPSVRDVLVEQLPNWQFGIFGEAYFLVLLLAINWPLFRSGARRVPQVLITLGVFYAVRGIIQLLFPIGPPIDAIPVGQRIDFYGFAEHAFFPGGHVGIMTIMLYFNRTKQRPWLIFGVVLFALGTAIARTHYVVDSLMGAILGYAVAVWLDRRRWIDRLDQPPARQDT